jgi:cytochrome c oxidase subunit 4
MEAERGRVIEDRTFVAVWIVLLFLTMLLVVSGKLFHETLSVPALLTVTPLKAGLVFYYFMHLKQEGPLLRTMVFVTLATLVVFIGLLFVDISYR